MTHQNQSSEVAAVVQLLANEGFEGMANAMQILLNEAMKLERSEHLNAKPYQRAKKRGRSSLNQFNELRPLFTLVNHERFPQTKKLAEQPLLLGEFRSLKILIFSTGLLGYVSRTSPTANNASGRRDAMFAIQINFLLRS